MLKHELWANKLDPRGPLASYSTVLTNLSNTILPLVVYGDMLELFHVATIKRDSKGVRNGAGIKSAFDVWNWVINLLEFILCPTVDYIDEVIKSDRPFYSHRACVQTMVSVCPRLWAFMPTFKWFTVYPYGWRSGMEKAV